MVEEKQLLFSNKIHKCTLVALLLTNNPDCNGLLVTNKCFKIISIIIRLHCYKPAQSSTCVGVLLWKFSEKVPEISELCTELLVRSTSRLDEIVNEHQVRIKDIQSGRNPEESFNAKSKQSDCNKELLQIEDDMKNLLHVIVEVSK